ncbi:MAG: CDP-diacylglycerol--glycerol-3-phosphate 3-phosphatidyltransferase [Bacilli bacterium]
MLRNLNTPNKITLVRFVFAFLVIIIYSLSFIPSSASFAPQIGTTGFTWIDLTCAILFILGSITDAIDGHIARSRNLITDFGKFMDPLADKFLVDASLILLSTKVASNGTFLLFPFITVLFIGRDLAMDGLRMLANSKGRVLAANIYGKIKTAMEMAIIPIIFLNGFPFSYFSFTGNANWEYTYIVTNILAGITLAMSLISCFIYFKQNKDVFEGDK